VSARVKEARRLHSPPLTQDQLSGKLAAEGVQLDRVAIAKIEGGMRCVFDYELLGLAKALRVKPEWLLEGRQTSGGEARAETGRRLGV
jgi:hypothetical protein